MGKRSNKNRVRNQRNNSIGMCIKTNKNVVSQLNDVRSNYVAKLDNVPVSTNEVTKNEQKINIIENYVNEIKSTEINIIENYINEIHTIPIKKNPVIVEDYISNLGTQIEDLPSSNKTQSYYMETCTLF